MYVTVFAIVWLFLWFALDISIYTRYLARRVSAIRSIFFLINLMTTFVINKNMITRETLIIIEIEYIYYNTVCKFTLDFSHTVFPYYILLYTHFDILFSFHFSFLFTFYIYSNILLMHNTKIYMQIILMPRQLPCQNKI